MMGDVAGTVTVVGSEARISSWGGRYSVSRQASVATDASSGPGGPLLQILNESSVLDVCVTRVCVIERVLC